MIEKRVLVFLLLSSGWTLLSAQPGFIPLPPSRGIPSPNRGNIPPPPRGNAQPTNNNILPPTNNNLRPPSNTGNVGPPPILARPPINIPPVGNIPRPPGTVGGFGDGRLKIVGGITAAAGKWPWQAMLIADGEFNCGGALVDSCHIVTAAHCVRGRDINTLMARLGEFDRDVSEPTERNVTYDEIYVHPTLDVAVIRLNEAQPSGRSVRPVSIRAGQLFGGAAVGQRVTVTGWGVVDPSTLEQAVRLQELELTIAAKTECRTRDRITLADDEFCAGYDPGRTYQNVCYGDSGGPVVWRMPSGQWALLGIVKRGVRNCPERFKYAIYTNVSVVYDYIADATSDVYTDLSDNRCMKMAPQGARRTRVQMPANSPIVTNSFSLRSAPTGARDGGSSQTTGNGREGQRRRGTQRSNVDRTASGSGGGTQSSRRRGSGSFFSRFSGIRGG